METTTENKPLILEHLRGMARRSHNGTSFSPEKRGDQMIIEFSEELEEDLQKIPEDQRTRYKESYEKFLTKWIHAKSRIVSTMIAGGSNFPVRRMQKYNNWEHGAWELFRSWRQRAFKMIARAEKKLLDPVVEMRTKLETAKATQEYMKKINKLHAVYDRKKNLEVLENQGLTDSEKNTIINYVPEYSWIKHPFAPYQFTNLNANIKRMEQRLAELESKQVAATTERFEEISFEGGQIVLNYEMDRIQIKFPGKPSPEIISKLKHAAFKWAPSQTAWQRQLTQNAKWTTEKLIKEISGSEFKF